MPLIQPKVAWFRGMHEPIDEKLLLAREQTLLAQERSYLADLRTFQSWIRTGLAVVGGGLALMRLLAFEAVSHRFAAQASGEAHVFLGIIIFIFSYIDYHNSCIRRYVQYGYTGSPTFCCLLSTILVLISLILMWIAFRPTI